MGIAIADGNYMISPENDRIYRTLTEGMDERELFILEHRILGPLALSAVGERFGISRERVRQLEKTIKKKLLLRLLRSKNSIDPMHRVHRPAGENCVAEETSRSRTEEHNVKDFYGVSP